MMGQLMKCGFCRTVGTAGLISGALLASGCALTGSSGGNKGLNSGSPKQSPTYNMPVDVAWVQKEKKAKWSKVFTRIGDKILARNENVVIGAAGDSEVLSALSNGQQEALGKSREVMKGGMPIEALDAMIDEASQAFVTKLATNDKVRNSEYKLVMVVDQFVDKSNSNNPKLDSALESIASKLQRNSTVLNDFVFVSADGDRAKSVLNKVSGNTSDFDDPFGEGPDTTSKVRYHPDLVYTLGGKMYLIEEFRKCRMQMKLFLDVVHPRSGQRLEGYEFLREYRYHPDRGWITAELDDQLASKYASELAE